MHNFWYHSPVRFYRTKEELEDKRNPQNNQFYGEGQPYPLEVRAYHSFYLPMHNTIQVNPVNCKLFLINDSGIEELSAEFKVNSDSTLSHIAFVCNKLISGRLGISADNGGTFFYYSNCVKFVDSTLDDGRKFIRILTRHNYNRNLFNYKLGLYIVTNLPAYDLGKFYIDAEINNTRTGGNNTQQIAETYLDEIVSYQFVCNGDANVLSFIQMATTNSEFYIDGTKRTLVEKIDADEFAMTGTMKFANVKDEYGLNITLNYT